MDGVIYEKVDDVDAYFHFHQIRIWSLKALQKTGVLAIKVFLKFKIKNYLSPLFLHIFGKSNLIFC